MRDVTDRVLAREARERAEEEKRNFYRTTIAAFTGGRLQVVDNQEIEAMISNPEIAVTVSRPEDATSARSVIREVMNRHGITSECAENFLMAVGEATTNAIRHGQGGEVLAGYDGEDVWVAVTDHGPGIETLALPRVTLELGYSGKVSLGMGYSMIMDMADRVWLSTGPNGTTVLMTCCAEVASPKEIIQALPDTW
jgi:anti-sigma regulatory factor (Ser/Thr protein kinase)